MPETESGILRALVRGSLRFRGVVVAVACLVIGYGLFVLTRANYDVFPEFASKQISIQTEAPGLSPEQVEQLVTLPVENAIGGAEGLASIRSSSVLGLSVVTAVFDDTTSIYRNRQVVAERLTELAGSLPAGVTPPRMTPLTSSTGNLMTIGLTSDQISATELRSIARWAIAPRLVAVPGVAQISIFGGGEREIQIQVDPEKMMQYGLTLDEIEEAARSASGIVGAGFVDTGAQRIVVQSIGQASSIPDLERAVVRHLPRGNVTLGDVAKVVDAAKRPINGATVMGEPGVLVLVWSQFGANTLDATVGVDEALGELTPTLEKQGVNVFPDLFRAARFVDTAMHGIRTSLLIGAVLVVVVLLAFLGHFRSAAISCTAIPLSLLAAVIVMHAMGMSLNTMTLGGLAIAIGEVVDDAVIDVENILRRLRGGLRDLSVGKRLSVILSASLEVRSAVVYASFAVVLVFLPVATLSGLAGKLFAPMATAYILAIGASLLVALTVTPALAALLIHDWKDVEEHRSWVLRMQSGYERLLHRLEGHSVELLLVAATLTLGGILLVRFLPTSFLPPLREGHYIVHLETTPGTSVEESLRIGNLVTEKLREISFVRSIAQRTGRAGDEDVFGPHSSEIEIDVRNGMSGDEEARAPDIIREKLANIAGGAFSVNSFLAERIEETISGYSAPIVASIYGDDLDVLDAKARELAAALSSVRGAVDVRFAAAPGSPLVNVRLSRDHLARWGVSAAAAMDAIRIAYDGSVVSQVLEGNRTTDVTVMLEPSRRNSVADIGALPIRGASGVWKPLRELADIETSEGRYSVLHDAARRVQTVTCDVRGRDLARFRHDAQDAASRIDLPPGTFIRFAGSAEEEARSKRDLALNTLVAAAGIALLLFLALDRWKHVTLVALNLPFALVGGVLALVATGHPLSLGATVGFVTLFGITLRNSLMMMSHFEHLTIVEGEPWSAATAFRGARERLLPIVMTSLVTALGLLPIAIASGSAGHEIDGPMALVILGGLFTSATLNLLLLPTLALRFARFDATE